MNLAQALAIAAAAWVTVMTVHPSMPAALRETQAKAERLAAGLQLRATIQVEQFAGGFRSTPDGLCIEHSAALR